MTRVLGLVALMLAVSATAFASVNPVVAPELDGGTALTALALLTGSVAVLRARFKR